MIGWALAGRATLKSELAARVSIDVASLPYRPDVVGRLRAAKSNGSRLVLATASAHTLAARVSDHLGVFDAVIATQPGGPNLKSASKAGAITDYFGDGDWAYIGDSRADLEVWERAQRAVAVAPSKTVLRAAAKLGVELEVVSAPRRNSLAQWIRQARLHQWMKNLLIFIPLLTSQQWTITTIVQSLIAFLAFGCAASAVYIVNDIRDLDADRRHATKRSRPLASGSISIVAAFIAASLLMVTSLLLSAAVGSLFLLALVGYIVLTSAYTVWLKRKIIADVVVLALLYAWRVVAGCAAILVEPSVWILAFSTFFFFSLALMKREAELVNHHAPSRGRGYRRSDAPLVLSAGTASGMAAILVLVLYLDSDEVRALYSTPQIMWLLVPLAMYWLLRAWMVTTRGGMHDDPVIFAIRDRISRVLVILIIVIVIGASWPAFLKS